MKLLGTDIKLFFQFYNFTLMQYQKCLEELKQTTINIETFEPQNINILTPPTTVKKKQQTSEKNHSNILL